jgi:flagellar hook-associated protein 2
MTTTTGSATYDPTTTATQLAAAYTSARQATLTQQTDRAAATSTALDKLGSALADFTASLAALSGKKSLLANSAAFSDSSVGTATASPLAAAGSYAFFVERLATAHQVSYSGLADSTAAGSGTLSIGVGTGSPITIDLSAANKDGDNMLSPKEIAAAINIAPGNNGKVIASILTVNGIARMVLSASSTGAASAITLDTSAVTNSAVKTALDAPANFKQMTPAQDAIVWLDAADAASGGTKLQQASNTYTVVDGVTMNFTKAQAAGAAPITMTVASDAAGSVSNVQSFVDAYNKLQKLVASQTDVGDPAKGFTAGAFANDAGVTSLKDHLAASIRSSVNGATLAKYGITASRDGVLSVNSTKLKSALAANPAGLDQVFGSATVGAKSGVMGDLDKYVNVWNNSVNGQITVRKASLSKQQTALVDRQATLDTQYNSAYKRYLAQFTALQALQGQMASTTTMFDAMFNNRNN